jgi:hypothetical protein
LGFPLSPGFQSRPFSGRDTSMLILLFPCVVPASQGRGGTITAGLALMSPATTPTLLDISAGALIGFGPAGTSFMVILSAFATLLPLQRRSLAFGLGTAAGSLQPGNYCTLRLFLPFQKLRQFGEVDREAPPLVRLSKLVGLGGSDAPFSASIMFRPCTVWSCLRGIVRCLGMACIPMRTRLRL